jgi:FkbM family methyltransferase
MLLNFEFLKKKYNLNISGVLHIGAHYGEEYEIYHRNHIKNIIFFEASPINFNILEQSLKDKANLVNIALGNEKKKVLLNVETNNNGQSNSILKPAKHLIQYPHILFESTIEVDMDRLDDFLETKTIDVKNYNLINIDVQGYELEVFKGSVKTLHNIDYIITEVNRDVVYYDNVLVEELDSFLKPYGFERVETSWDGNTWGDAFYIKKI